MGFRWKRVFSDSWRSRRYQDCVCNIGVINTLLRTGLSKKRAATSNFMSDPMSFDKHPCLCSEGLLSKTCKLELCEILYLPKSSRSGFPQGCQFFWKALGFSFHSLEFMFRYWRSASSFSASGRYSAVIRILFFTNYRHSCPEVFC